MKPFVPFTKPEEVDFFSIYTRDGVKYIHIWGYTYESSDYDYITEDNPDGLYWANMEACGIEIPLQEYLDERYNNDDLYEEASQYQGDYDEGGMVATMNHYYNDIVFSVDYPAKNEGAPDAFLDFGELTMDTPDGDYVTYPLDLKLAEFRERENNE
jgi:hypothetical protein